LLCRERAVHIGRNEQLCYPTLLHAKAGTDQSRPTGVWQLPKLKWTTFDAAGHNHFHVCPRGHGTRIPGAGLPPVARRHLQPHGSPPDHNLDLAAIVFATIR